MKKYSIFITHSSKNGSMRRLSISSTQIRVACLIGLAVFIAVGIFSFDYTLAISRHAELKQLRQENESLNDYVKSISTKAEKLENHLQRIEDFTTRLKTITRHQGELNGIGPLPYSQVDSFSDWRNRSQEKENSKKKELLINQYIDFQEYLDNLEKRSHLVQKEIWQTIGYLEERKHLLAVTPTINPVIGGGRITSHFGYRDHPVSGEGFGRDPHFHNGLDIAARSGVRVVAPANGIVRAVGYDSGTGNYIVIDHGYQLQTLYGHLKSAHVRRYQRIKRGDHIGSIGNTGRSTGPHLHYEVRVSKKPVDPEHYILNIL